MKFVIHIHETNDIHYDLMFEKELKLETWQFNNEEFKSFLKGNEVHSKKIQNHGKKYLNYEGPISCNRGKVKIFDSGEYAVEKWDNDLISILLYGKRLHGKITLSKNFKNEQYRAAFKNYDITSMCK